MKQVHIFLFILLLVPTLACNLGTSYGETDSSALGTEVALQQTQVALQQTQVALEQPGSQSTAPANNPDTQPTATQAITAVATQPPATHPPAPAATQPPPPAATEPPPPPTEPPPPDNSLTTEDQYMILDFTRQAAYAFIDAYWYGDASYAEPYYAGVSLQEIQTEIADLNSQGLYAYYEYDEGSSFLTNIKLTTEGLYIVDACEYWNATTYTLANDEFVATLDWAIYPQTMYIQNIGGQLRITDVTHHSDTSVCAP